MRGRVLAWVAAVAMTVGGATVAVVGYRDADGPADVVRAYFAAVARGDAPAALALGDLPAGDRSFLTSDVLRVQQEIGRIGDVHVDDTEATSSPVSVHVAYTLRFARGDEPVETSVDVARRGDVWRLVHAAAQVRLHVTAAQNLATLAGAAVPDAAVLLFPGAVPVQFATTYLTVQPDTGGVTPAETGDHDITPAVSPAGATALRGALASRLSRCFPAGGPSGAACPLPSGDRVVPGSLSGRLAARATSAVEFAVDGVGDGRVHLTGRLPFTGRYEQLDFQNLPAERTGRIMLALDASAAPVEPARIVFGGTA